PSSSRLAGRKVLPGGGANARPLSVEGTSRRAFTSSPPRDNGVTATSPSVPARGTVAARTLACRTSASAASGQGKSDRDATRGVAIHHPCGREVGTHDQGASQRDPGAGSGRPPRPGGRAVPRRRATEGQGQARGGGDGDVRAVQGQRGRVPFSPQGQ